MYKGDRRVCGSCEYRENECVKEKDCPKMKGTMLGCGNCDDEGRV